MDRTRQMKNQKAVEDGKKPRNKVDLAGEESFPASDPPAYSTPQPSEADEKARSPQQADHRTPARKQADWKPADGDQRLHNEAERHQDKTAHGAAKRDARPSSS